MFLTMWPAPFGASGGIDRSVESAQAGQVRKRSHCGIGGPPPPAGVAGEATLGTNADSSSIPESTILTLWSFSAAQGSVAMHEALV